MTKVSNCLPTPCFNALFVSWLDKEGAGNRRLLLFTQISTHQTKKPLFLSFYITKKNTWAVPPVKVSSVWVFQLQALVRQTMITQQVLSILTASVGVFFNLLLSTFIVDNLCMLLLSRNVHVHQKATHAAEFQCFMIQNYLDI